MNATATLSAETLTFVEALVATLPAKVQAILALKGQFVSITYGRECKVRKGAPMVLKYSKMTLRAGISYDEIAAVQAKRESGELPEENAGLSWGSYVPGLFPYIISHTAKGETGPSLYFRFFTVPNSARVSPTYTLNGKEITEKEARVHCLASEFTERETTLETMTLRIEGILEVNGKGV